MSNGHSESILENREGALRAVEDFKAGLTENPFPVGGGWQRLAWEVKTKQLVCRRDHGIVCCQEHNQHLAGRFNRSHMGLTSCSFCEKKLIKSDREGSRRKMSNSDQEFISVPKYSMIPLPVASDARREANGRRASVGDDDRCIVCNAPVNDASPAVGWVHLSTSGNLFPVSVTVEEIEGDPNAVEGTMYFHPVGSGCSRKIPKGYLKKD